MIDISLRWELNTLVKEGQLTFVVVELAFLLDTS